MSERMRESLSAMMDDEAQELELERVLSRIAEDGELRQTWVRYSAVRAALSGQQVACPGRDISGAVRLALSSEADAPSDLAGKGIRERVLRPLASFAVAASVAATVVIGGQQLARISGAGPEAGDSVLAGNASPVGMVNSLGATSVQASFGTQAVPVLQPATRTAYRELARQRMEKYMQEHAEHAALNSPQGLVPFARVAEIRE
jgi:sigma-E factor negative regulatory protein RseA